MSTCLSAVRCWNALHSNVGLEKLRMIHTCIANLRATLRISTEIGMHVCFFNLYPATRIDLKIDDNFSKVKVENGAKDSRKFFKVAKCVNRSRV